MKNLNKFLTILGLFIIVVLLAVTNYEPIETTIQKAEIALPQPALKEAIQKGFQTGAVALLFPYFDEVVNISVEDKEEIYPASNAQAVLQNFFDKYPPATFQISHSGKSRGGEETYYIGDYTDEIGQKLRIYIFVEKALIQEIEISNQIINS